MYIPLSEILDDPIFRSARPAVLAGESLIPGIKVRWVHSTDLLDIAQLLRGGELLLTTGQELLRLRDDAQIAHLRALADRGIAALALEPYARNAVVTSQLINAAEMFQLPLIRLHATVPFVDLAERINRSIVSKQAVTLQQADMLSQRLAQHMATAGPNLTPLLQMISDELGVEATMQTLDGHVIAAAGIDLLEAASRSTSLDSGTLISTDIFVGGDVAAQMLLACNSVEEHENVSMVAERLGVIIGLAYAQHHRPSRAQLANLTLMHSIINKSGQHFIAERALEAGIGAGYPICIAVIQSHDMSRMRANIERVLHENIKTVRTSLQNNRLYVLLELQVGDARGSRTGYVQVLREALRKFSVECAVGPAVNDIRWAQVSLDDALLLDRFSTFRPDEGRLRDASDYALERLFTKVGGNPSVEAFVGEMLGELLEWDQSHRGQLVHTLHAWLSTGCNATATAGRLYLERQTLHKRLKKIFSLLGGDPRETDRLLQLHLACRIQSGEVRSVR